MTIDTKKLRELAEAATPGPWRWRFSCVEQISDSGQGFPLDFYPDCKTVQESACHECGTKIGLSNQDGTFIASASPDVVVALLDEIERLTRENAERTSDLVCADRDQLRLHEIANAAISRLATMTAARDAACDLAAEYFGCALSHAAEMEMRKRVAELREVGAK